MPAFLQLLFVELDQKSTEGGDVMCVCLYQKSVWKEYRTEGVYRRYIQHIRISVFVLSRRVHLFIVNCLLKNKFNIHVFIYLSQYYKQNFRAKNIIWFKFAIN